MPIATMSEHALCCDRDVAMNGTTDANAVIAVIASPSKAPTKTLDPALSSQKVAVEEEKVKSHNVLCHRRPLALRSTNVVAAQQPKRQRLLTSFMIQSVPSSLRIATPTDQSIFATPPKVTTNAFLLDQILPSCEEMATALVDKHYVFNPRSNYWREFNISLREYKLGTSIIYAEYVNGKLVKIGKTGNHKNRKEANIEKQHGADAERVLVPILHMDLLEPDMDTFLDKCCKEMIRKEIIDNDKCHPFFRNHFRSILEEGGEQLGMVHTLIASQIEVGLQSQLNLTQPAEFLMFDEKILDMRHKHVNEAVSSLLRILRQVVGPGLVPVHFVSSWMTGYFHQNHLQGGNRLCTTQMMMESIAAKTVDMFATDTLNYARYPNPTSAKEAFDSEYTPLECDKGIDRLLEIVFHPKHINDNSPRASVVDTNDVLFQHKKSTDRFNSVKQLFASKGYIVTADAWEGEMILMAHRQKKHAIVLHKPFSFAGDARDEVKSSTQILRAMTHTVLKEVVADLQGKTGPGNALEAAYRKEHIIGGMHYRNMYGAAAFRAALVEPSGDVKPLKQNNLPKKTSDFHAANLRTKDNRSRNGKLKEVTDFTVDHLLYRKCLNVLSNIDDANDTEEVDYYVKKVDELLLGSGGKSSDTTAKAKRMNEQWIVIKGGFMPNSTLFKAIDARRSAKKQNTGNTGATGRTTKEKMQYRDEFEEIMALGVGTPFYIRTSDKNHKEDTIPEVLPNDEEEEDEAEEDRKKVFPKYTFEGIRNRLKSYNKTNKSSTPYMTVHYVRDDDGNLQYCGEEGNATFVCVHLLEYDKTADDETREGQLQQLRALGLNKAFWVLMNQKADPEDRPKSRMKDEPVFSTVKYNTLNDILKREREECQHNLTTKKYSNAQQGGYFKVRLVEKKKRSY